MKFETVESIFKAFENKNYIIIGKKPDSWWSILEPTIDAFTIGQIWAAQNIVAIHIKDKKVLENWLEKKPTEWLNHTSFYGSGWKTIEVIEDIDHQIRHYNENEMYRVKGESVEFKNITHPINSKHFICGWSKGIQDELSVLAPFKAQETLPPLEDRIIYLKDGVLEITTLFKLKEKLFENINPNLPEVWVHDKKWLKINKEKYFKCPTNILHLEDIKIPFTQHNVKTLLRQGYAFKPDGLGLLTRLFEQDSDTLEVGPYWIIKASTKLEKSETNETQPNTNVSDLKVVHMSDLLERYIPTAELHNEKFQIDHKVSKVALTLSTKNIEYLRAVYQTNYDYESLSKDYFVVCDENLVLPKNDTRKDLKVHEDYQKELLGYQIPTYTVEHYLKQEKENLKPIKKYQNFKLITSDGRKIDDCFVIIPPQYKNCAKEYWDYESPKTNYNKGLNEPEIWYIKDNKYTPYPIGSIGEVSSSKIRYEIKDNQLFRIESKKDIRGDLPLTHTDLCGERHAIMPCNKHTQEVLRSYGIFIDLPNTNSKNLYYVNFLLGRVEIVSSDEALQRFNNNVAFIDYDSTSEDFFIEPNWTVSVMESTLHKVRKYHTRFKEDNKFMSTKDFVILASKEMVEVIRNQKLINVPQLPIDLVEKNCVYQFGKKDVYLIFVDNKFVSATTKDSLTALNRPFKYISITNLKLNAIKVSPLEEFLSDSPKSPVEKMKESFIKYKFEVPEFLNETTCEISGKINYDLFIGYIINKKGHIKPIIWDKNGEPINSKFKDYRLYRE